MGSQGFPPNFGIDSKMVGELHRGGACPEPFFSSRKLESFPKSRGGDMDEVLAGKPSWLRVI